MATIKNIAERVGVSISTVSYALNGGPRKVPEDIRERVLLAARELNYRPNRLARSLVTGKAGMHGLIIGAEADENLVREILGRTQDRGEDLMTIAAKGDPTLTALAALDGRLDGVIVIGDETVATILKEQQFPCVALHPSGDISADQLAGFRAALDHLEQQGHTRFAAIAPSAQEQDELEERVHMRGLDIPSDLILEGPADLEAGYRIGRQILANSVRPTAILAGSDQAACGLMHAFREEQFEAPRDYSVVGCGDTEWSSATAPPLTTIHIPYRELAHAALAALTQPMAEPQVFATELVVRGSTGRPSRTPVSLKRFDRDRLRGL